MIFNLNLPSLSESHKKAWEILQNTLDYSCIQLKEKHQYPDSENWEFVFIGFFDSNYPDWKQYQHEEQKVKHPTSCPLHIKNQEGDLP